MTQYLHHVSGFFANREAANNALFRLMQKGLPRGRLKIFSPASAAPPRVSKSESDEVLKDILMQGAIGAVIGIVIGALAEVALVVANVSLFVASPLIAPLMLMGWGASVGGFMGAAIGAAKKKGLFSARSLDAASSGQVVLVAETQTAQETAVAGEVMQAAVGAYEDTGTT